MDNCSRKKRRNTIANIIIGYESEKKEIAKLREMLHHVDSYRKCGIRIPRGIVLYGRPGVGKTVLARSLADDGINLFEFRASLCNENYEEVLENIFKEAKSSTPSVILLDEIDKIAGTSNKFFMEKNEDMSKILLQKLDSLTLEDSVLVIATCNDIDCMSPALLRAGRFDKHLSIDPPDEETRYKIIEAYFSKIKLKNKVNISLVSKMTRGYTGAKIECLVNETGIIALDKEDNCITDSDVILAINRLEFQSNERSVTKDKENLRKIAIHEAGHAIVAMYLTPDSLFNASVLPQGESEGHIRFVHQENVFESIEEIKKQVSVHLAGKVAEKYVLGEFGTGCSYDLHVATIATSSIITELAGSGYKYLSATLGNFRAGNNVASFPGLVQEIERQLNIADRKALDVIIENKKVFDEIVNALVENHTLNREQLFEIKEKYESMKKATDNTVAA